MVKVKQNDLIFYKVIQSRNTSNSHPLAMPPRASALCPGAAEPALSQQWLHSDIAPGRAETTSVFQNSGTTYFLYSWPNLLMHFFVYNYSY